MSDSYSQKTVYLLLKFLRANQETSEKKQRMLAMKMESYNSNFIRLIKFPL